jgi:methionyl-tRNA synthetase
MADVINIEDFAKLDLRAGKIVNAQKVPGKDKLLVLQVDIGTETRTVVAGIAQEFSPEELIGKQVVLVANLEPKRIGGIVSHGMILAAGEEKALAIVTLDREVPPGTKVR